MTNKRIIKGTNLLGIYFLAFLLIFLSCQKNSNSSVNTTSGLPSVNTDLIQISTIIGTSATCGGFVQNTGTSQVTSRGVCWSINQVPTISDNHTIDGSGFGNFTSNITGLSVNTTYYVRAYATNSVGTSYGLVVTFTTSNVHNIYVVGSIYSTSVLWLNNIQNALSALSIANSVFVSGGDVYVVGVGLQGTSYIGAELWKNGVKTELSPTGEAFNVFVSGSDVYVVGNNKGAGILWKNGVETIVSANGTATGLYVSGSDVYVAGTDALAGGFIWKNGVKTHLPSSINAFSVFVSGVDVYVSGQGVGVGQNYVAAFWKNNSLIKLPSKSSPISGSANSIYVSGTDVYIAGQDGASASVLWKNGVLVFLNDSNGYIGENAYSVFVMGTDVYVAGTSFNQAILWKNGVPATLSNSGSANCVFVY